MKKRVAGLVMGIMALSCSVPSVTVAMPYVRGSVGLSYMGNESTSPVRSYDAGYTIAGAIGTDSGRNRIEAEFGHQNNGVKDIAADVSRTTYLANYYLDLSAPVVPIKPFLTAGAGLANVEQKSGSALSNDSVFAWQIGAGVGFSSFPFVSVDVQYRHLGGSSAELFNRKYSIDSNSVTVGLRVSL